MEDGLAGNYIRKVQQDKDGFLWVLSNIGLQRFDGVRFIDFNLPEVVAGGTMEDILIDKKNRLWVYFQNHSIANFNTSTFRWEWYTVEKSNRQASLFESQDGRIMILYKGGKLMTLDERTKIFSEKSNPFQIPQDWKLISLTQDYNANYWVGTSEGLVKYNPTRRTLSSASHNSDDDPYISLTSKLRHIQNFYISKDNIAWITSWPLDSLSFLRINVPGKTKTELIHSISSQIDEKYFTISSTLETETDLWIYGETLLARYDNHTQRFKAIPPGIWNSSGIYFDIVTQIFEDREHNLWVATNDGLYRYASPSPFLKTTFNYVPEKDSAFTQDVTDVLETKSGEILVSTWGAGIFSYDQNFHPTNSVIQKHQASIRGMVWCMVQTDNSDLWFGAQSGWLYHYNAATGQIRSFQPELAQGRTIRVMKKDQNGNLWIGTQGGHVIKYNIAKDKWQLVYKSNNIIGRIIISQKNEIWVATGAEGVFRINAASGKILAQYTDSGPPGSRIPITSVTDIIEYNDSTVLFTTGVLNVLHVNTGIITVHNRPKDVLGLQKDKSGNIWAATGTGLKALTFPDFKELINFGPRQGVSNLNFSQAASTRLKNRNIVFGNNHGFLHFTPDSLLNENRRSKFEDILISELFINERKFNVDSILKLKKLTLGPGQVSIRIRYATNTYKNDRTIFFQIAGTHSDWQEVASNNEVVLTYLPTGSYELKAGLKDSNNEISEYLSLPVDVTPQFYRSTWFYVLISLLTLIALFFIDRYRMRRKEFVQQLRRNIATQLHLDISSTLEQVNILSDIAIIKHEDDPEKSKEFISEIKTRSSNMISAMKDMLWSISPENDNTKELINRFYEQIDSLNNKYQLDYKLTSGQKAMQLSLNMQIRYELLLIFKRTIKTFMKSGVAQLKVHIGCRKNNVLYFIFEYENGIEDNRQLNNYLNRGELAEKIKKLNGEIITSTKLKTSELIFKINL